MGEARGGQGVGDATHFLSHAQSETLAETISVIWAYIGANTTFGALLYFWVDYFTLRQNVKGDFQPDFVAAIITCLGVTVMVCSPWDAPAALERVWCLFEVVTTCDNHAALHVQLTADAEGEMMKTLGTAGAHKSLTGAFAGIDIKKAKAHNPKDIEKIFAIVDKMPDGAAGVNRRV